MREDDASKLYAYKRSGADAKDANGKQVRDSAKDITLPNGAAQPIEPSGQTAR